MAPILPRKERDRYWKRLSERFPYVPAEVSIEDGQSPGPEMKHGTSVLSCLFSPDGKHIVAAGGGRMPGCDSSIRVWDAGSGKERMVLHAHVHGIYQLAFDPRSGFLASASEDYSVILWNLEQREALFLVGGDPIVKGHVAFAGKTGLLAVGETEAFEDLVSSVFVIDLDAGKQVFRRKLKEDEAISALAITANGSRLFFAVQDFHYGGESVLHCWNLKRGVGEWRKSFPEMTFTELLLLAGEKTLAAAVMSDEESETLSGVCLLDAASGEVRAQRLLPGIGSDVARFARSEVLAVAHGQGPLELVKLPDLSPIKALTSPDEKSRFGSVQVSPNDKMIIAGLAEQRSAKSRILGRLQKFDPRVKGFPASASFQTAEPLPMKAGKAPEELLALLDAVKKDPEEDRPRLALADWLDKQGDPRGELVRIQCQSTRLPNGDRQRVKLEARAKNLLEQHEKEWLGPLVQLTDSCRCRRGMLHVDFKRKKFFSEAATVWMSAVSAVWTEHLTIYDLTTQDVAQVARLPFLANVTSLDVNGKFGAAGLKALLASPYLTHLTNLELGATGLRGADMDELVKSPLLDRLTGLCLSGNDIGDAGVQTLAASSRVARLTHLELAANEIGEVGARALAASPHLACLTHLDLGNNYLDDPGVAALADSPHLAKLTHLSLWFAAIGPEGAVALASSRYMRNIAELNLMSNGTLPGTAAEKALHKRFGKKVLVSAGADVPMPTWPLP